MSIFGQSIRNGDRMSTKYEKTLDYLKRSKIPLSIDDPELLKEFIDDRTTKFNQGDWYQKIITPSREQL